MAELGTIPKIGLLYLALCGAALAASDLLSWAHGPALRTEDYVVGLVLTTGWAVAIYSVSMMMMGARTSPLGFAKFVATSIAMLMPLLVSIALFVVAVKANSGVGIAVSCVVFVAALGVTALLPGWPLLQATTEKFVGPLTAFASTKGYRWPLIMGALVISAINRAATKVSDADDFSTAAVLALVDGTVAVASTAAGLSIAVVAWKLMRLKIESHPRTSV
ncbi:hypothetical protein [Brevundimonas sp.]|uniref:hypothetical protein n=1 Tax=Brevundimonas sp. TaxID=1871086 RepID=UPI003BABFB91